MKKVHLLCFILTILILQNCGKYYCLTSAYKKLNNTLEKSINEIHNASNRQNISSIIDYVVGDLDHVNNCYEQMRKKYSPHQLPLKPTPKLEKAIDDSRANYKALLTSIEACPMDNTTRIEITRKMERLWLNIE